EDKASTAKPSNAQKKLKFKQEESFESAKTDSDYAEYLRTYDPKDEESDSEEVTSKLSRTNKSKKKVSKLPESVQDS
ncbi:hypothetical protein A2U01_0099531, partial [Trifolium medium]|nr:hypothetical protein [Trifolium medium]